MDINKVSRFANLTRQAVLAERALVADSYLKRLRGLLFRPPLASGQGLYLERCQCIHMFGMVYPIDALFVDADWQVVGLVESLTPWAVSPFFRKAAGCLELPAGTISATSTKVGDQIKCQEIFT